MNGRLEKKEKRSFFFSLIRGWLTYLYLSLRGHFFFLLFPLSCFMVW